MKETNTGPKPELVEKGFCYEGFDGQKHTYSMSANEFLERYDWEHSLAVKVRSDGETKYVGGRG